jgi:hypothetical protein
MKTLNRVVNNVKTDKAPLNAPPQDEFRVLYSQSPQEIVGVVNSKTYKLLVDRYALRLNQLVEQLCATFTPIEVNILQGKISMIKAVLKDLDNLNNIANNKP